MIVSYLLTKMQIISCVDNETLSKVLAIKVCSLNGAKKKKIIQLRCLRGYWK